MKFSRMIILDGNEDFIKRTIERSIPVGIHLNSSFMLKDNTITVGIAADPDNLHGMLGVKHCFSKNGYSENKEIEKLKEDLSEALDRVEDMYRNDDGQAWKEAERFLIKHGRTKYV